MKTGVAYAVAGTAIIVEAVAAQLVTRIGVKPVLTVEDDDADRRPHVLPRRSPSAARTSATSCPASC